ncbi:MAG TPA: hypothetical protein DCG39_11470 [Opitutae bacterium]|nr:hypothetical protein [Opitutae bacterium]|tara:strand:- start:5929 stop:7851 length:1923 start_codon:yes stop_codon:yes gene_type:complete
MKPLVASLFVFAPVFLFAGAFEEEVLPILKRSCLKCHGGEKTKGKVDFSAILTESDAGDHLDLWETVVEVVELGEMPPEEEKPLSPAERKKIRDWREAFIRLPVETTLSEFRPRRLSANEYRNTLRSLFGFDLEVGIARAEQTVSGEKSLALKLLPPDPPGGSGYFNDTHAVPLSSSLLENYAYLAGAALDRLFSRKGRDSLARMVDQGGDWKGETSPAFAEKFLRSFLPRALRRTVPDEKIKTVLDRLGDKEGEALVSALKFELKAVLISPEFLYRGFLAKPEGKPGRQPVDDFELAERLSYFIWEDMPDEELMKAARKGTLREKGEVSRQIGRMLADPKARNLSESFGVQLLALSSIDDQIKNNPIHLHAMRTQPRDFLHYLFTEDRPVMELLDSNVTFVNQSTSGFYGNDRRRLAPFHKPKGVERQRTMNQRLEIRDAEGRGGILTMPSILAMNHGPILRGTWVLRHILGVRLGEPPADVPPIKPVPRGKKMTFRERFEAHRENATCARCHEKIDPIGFALDGYDRNGRYLLASYHKRGNQPPIDTSGKLPSGEKFEDFQGLKSILLSRKREQIVRHLSSQVLSYALCRKLGRGDQPVIEEITRKVTLENSTWRELLIEVANSPPFRETVFRQQETK